MLKHNPLKSKTFWGALLSAVSLVLAGDRNNAAVWTEAIGLVIAAVGLRDASTKDNEKEAK